MRLDSAAAAAKSLQSCPTLCDPLDCSLPGSSVHGIFQARTLEWVAISFSNAWKWKVKVKSLSPVLLLATPWTAVYQASWVVRMDYFVLIWGWVCCSFSQFVVLSMILFILVLGFESRIPNFPSVDEKAMAPHSSTLAWKIPWTEEPGRLQSRGSLRVGHDWATSLSLFTFMHWRRKWQLTPVFLPGESQGRGSLVGCHLWGHTELDTTEVS